MFILPCLLPLLPLITPILAIPSIASSVESLHKRDDCHGSGNCGKNGASVGALEIYNQYPNNISMYNDYTSYVVGHYAAMYSCPKGKYPAGVTGANLFDWGQQIFKPKSEGGDQCGFCGTHWLEDTDNALKCRMTLNWCSHCTETVNGVQGAGAGLPPAPVPVAASVAAAAVPPAAPAVPAAAPAVPAAAPAAPAVPAAAPAVAGAPAAAPATVVGDAGSLSGSDPLSSGLDPISQLDEYDAQFDSDPTDSEPLPGDGNTDPSWQGGLGY